MEQKKIEIFFYHILLNNFFYYQCLKKDIIHIFYKNVEEITHNVTIIFIFILLFSFN